MTPKFNQILFKINLLLEFILYVPNLPFLSVFLRVLCVNESYEPFLYNKIRDFRL